MRWLHLSGCCVISSEKSMNFMLFFYNSCTRNCDHHILLIKTGNAHKQKMLPQIIINTCNGGQIETQSKLMVAAKCCFYKYRNKPFGGKHILRCGAAPFLFIFVMLNSLAELFVLLPA